MKKISTYVLKSKIVIFTTLFLACSILIPVFLEQFLFRSNKYSALTNGEWGGFLGSYLGGIISGIGTLIAVYVTTIETRKIQKNAQKNFENDKRIRLENERKQFTDSIAQMVSEYITDILKYYYSNRYLPNIEKELECLIQQIEKLDINKDIVKTNTDNEKQKILIKYDQKLYERNKWVHERNIAIKNLYLLKINLNGIDNSSELIEQVEAIHNKYCFDKGQTENFNMEINKLLEIVCLFSEKYIRS